MRSVLLAKLISICTLLLSGCSPVYLIQSGIEQSRILLARESISELLKSNQLDQELKTKLELVLEARDFAAKMGLTPGQSYLQYVKIPRDSLAWVVMATPPDSFSFYTWWYPIVGTVPYKGYFNQDHAYCLADRLEFKGLETSVRGTDAMSTLGYFNDPILSTTLSRAPHLVVNTVIHEIFHATLWIPDHVAFNESVANFIGLQGAIDFFESQHVDDPELLLLAKRQYAAELELRAVVTELYSKLDTLYQSTHSRPEKLRLRQEIFEHHAAPLRINYPNLQILQTINNAEILQLKIYLQGLPDFEQLFKQCDRKWDCFLEKLEEVKAGVSQGHDPFDLIAQMV